MDILNQNRRSRNIQISMISLRMKENSRMKIPYNMEYELSFKNKGNEEFIDVFDKHLADKEKYYKHADAMYQETLN